MKKKIEELKPVPHYESIPDCGYIATSRLRIYKKKNKNGNIIEILEQMFLDDNGMAFWAPVPKEGEDT